MNTKNGRAARNEKSDSRTSILKYMLSGLVVIAVVGALFAAGIISTGTTSTTIPDKGTSESAAEETEATLEMLGKHILLPENEKPVVATIKDVSELKSNSAFYKNASNGDKLIVFSKTKKAIIFSTDKDIIINAGIVVSSEEE